MSDKEDFIQRVGETVLSSLCNWLEQDGPGRRLIQPIQFPRSRASYEFEYLAHAGNWMTNLSIDRPMCPLHGGEGLGSFRMMSIEETHEWLKMLEKDHKK
jgi:hypothetical protein